MVIRLKPLVKDREVCCLLLSQYMILFEFTWAWWQNLQFKLKLNKFSMDAIIFTLTKAFYFDSLLLLHSGLLSVWVEQRFFFNLYKLFFRGNSHLFLLSPINSNQIYCQKSLSNTICLWLIFHITTSCNCSSLQVIRFLRLHKIFPHKAGWTQNI